MVEPDRAKASGPALKLTYDDFVLFPDDGKRHELIDGEHFVTPSPNIKHQRIVGNLHFAIRSWLDTNPIGQVFLSPLDVVMSEVDVVEPDLLFVTSARAPDILTVQHVRGTPDLVVEVASKGTRKRDETIKRRLYERSGLQEYWVVDPEIDVVRIYRREGASLGRALELSLEADEVLRSPLLPGLDIPLARIFKDT